MSKHTPGPWNAEGPDWAGDFNIAPSSETACVAAAVSNMRPAEEVSANATLIAAAPDLLQALVNLIDEAEDVFVCMADATGIDRHNLPPQFAAARAALAKAEARS